MGETKPSKITETKLKRVAQLSSENPSKEFMWLMPHVNNLNPAPKISIIP